MADKIIEPLLEGEIQALRDKAGGAELEYFFDLAKRYYLEPESLISGESVGVLRALFPEEIIYAAGFKPHFIFSGFKAHMTGGAELAPRDCEPQLKAGLTLMESRRGLAALIVPMISDNARKSLEVITEKLGEKTAIIPVESPDPVRSDFVERYWSEMTESLLALTRLNLFRGKSYGRIVEKLLDVLGFVRGVGFDSVSLLDAVERVNTSRKLRRKLLFFLEEGREIAPSLIYFLVNSYYLQPDIDEWIFRAQQAVNDLEKIFPANDANERRGGITLVGEQIYFPAFKIINILEELGVGIAHIYTETTASCLTDTETGEDIPVCIVKAIRRRFTAIPEKTQNGVVIQLFKGQIPFDFTAYEYERTAVRQEIPYLKVETDYGEEDREPLKIRLEAFKELLQRRGRL